jgi:hypothetical protein
MVAEWKTIIHHVRCMINIPIQIRGMGRTILRAFNPPTPSIWVSI